MKSENPYKSERTQLRAKLREEGLQDTQRSWTNYVGAKPYESWVGTRAYEDSPSWSYGGSMMPYFTKSKKPLRSQNIKTEAVIAGPLAFTGFGKTTRSEAAEQTLSPLGGGLSNVGTNLFGAPRFPFAGANSVFERASQHAPLGVPRFLFAGYNQPNPPFIY